jgi:benzodiazapine receptor
MKFIAWLFVFLILNFGALYVGNLFMDNGPQTSWYLALNKAPWTPPGWVFGAAWTTIMLCFSVYMALLVSSLTLKTVSVIYSIQLVLNMIWNYIFFNMHQVNLGLIVIVLLSITVLYMFFKYIKVLKLKSLLILPYAIWLIIATSLNLYITLNN